ncbi:hypothetical protein CgunFtcFv8_002668 [Champsocephalus gunnari]|uniref:Ig-like domain-containing protein n=1 Tax=Champsocephalus gunnari TaxID=52237 RepID=A0AAN8HJP5_CHAGU|nr:hypothetical protein CgunFtcFv8_002668 [Champsocephalus gunnari]
MFSTGLVSVALFFLSATGVRSFSVTTNNNNLRVEENEGADLTCSYSADFGSSARIEWKFKDIKGSQTYVVFDGKPTQPYAGRVTLYGNNLRINKVTRKDNGVYDCEVSAGAGQFGEVRVQLTVLVPPSPPMCRIPSSVKTGKVAIKIAGFRNATYKLSAISGNLEYPAVTKMDSGQYYCEAVNDAGAPQRCKGLKMEVRDANTGGIVAGVIVALLLLLLLGLGIWYAHKKGYLPKKAESKPKPSVVYQPTSLHSGDGGGGDDEDGEFKQKSSFVV